MLGPEGRIVQEMTVDMEIDEPSGSQEVKAEWSGVDGVRSTGEGANKLDDAISGREFSRIIAPTGGLWLIKQIKREKVRSALMKKVLEVAEKSKQMDLDAINELSAFWNEEGIDGALTSPLEAINPDQEC